MTGDFGRGLRRPLDGARWIAARPALRRLVALPVVMQTILLAAGIALGVAFVGPWLAGLIPLPDRSDPLGLVLRVLAWLWTPLAYVLAVVLAGFLGVIVGRFLSEPLYDALSQDVDAEAGGSAPPSPEGIVVLLDALRGLLHTTLGVVLVTSLSCLLLALNLVPVVGSLAEAVLSTGSAAFFLAVEALDYPLSRRRLTWVGKVRWAWARRWEALGLGGAMLLGLIVPLAIVVVLPAAIAGATLWVVEEERGRVTGA